VKVRTHPDFETVAIVYSQPELAVLLSYLGDRGIWTVPLTYGHAAVQWTWTVALGGIRVRVRREDAVAARDALAAIERRAFVGGIYSDDRLLDIVFALLLTLAFFIPPPARIPAFFLPGGRVAKPARHPEI
jgi:hypothetical protein